MVMKGKYTRLEVDSMGEMAVPKDALYGASTARAIENFPISGKPMPEIFIQAMGLLKAACAKANETLGLLDAGRSEWIQKAALEVFRGNLLEHFPVDVFQTGSCTSSNMNINEVISNWVSQKCDKPVGSKDPVHPNDHVNMSQSSNDSMPTALHISLVLDLRQKLMPTLTEFSNALELKGQSWKNILKVGRTHLMDATPMRMGDVFSAYASQLTGVIAVLEASAQELARSLAIGGTAVGTGINCPSGFPENVCRALEQLSELVFEPTQNHFAAQSGRDACVSLAGHLSRLVAVLMKIANDLRLLGSGPRCGIGELILPATQPGSSIMPGKVNPVMCEMMVQVCLYSQGQLHTVMECGRSGQFELNTTIPLIAHCLHEVIELLCRAMKSFDERCLAGLQVNEARCQYFLDQSLMLVTALNPYIGYDAAARVAKKAHDEGKSLREVVLEGGLLDEQTLDRALDPLTQV